MLLANASHEAGHAAAAEVLGVPVVAVEVFDGDGNGVGGTVDLDYFWSPGEKPRDVPVPSPADSGGTAIERQSNADRGVYDVLETGVLAKVPIILAAGRMATFRYLSVGNALLGAVHDLAGERRALALLKLRGVEIPEHEAAADRLVRAHDAVIDDLAHELVLRAELTGPEVREILRDHGLRTTEDLRPLKQRKLLDTGPSGRRKSG